MKFKTESKRIGAYTYHVQQLDAVRGSNALLRLLKVIGPAFEADDEGGALAKLAGSLSESELRWFCDLFAGQTTVTGGDIPDDHEPQLDGIFGEHFAGNYFAMLEWLRFAFEVNYASFFVIAAAKYKAAMAKSKVSAATPSTSPTTSTGTSGE